MKIAVAFDHRGVYLRDAVREALEGHEIIDLGTDTPDVRIDYPDKAREVGETIQRGEAERGILVCGSGAGAAIAACKMSGIRAAICHDLYSAHQAVEHDDMNVLCLGSEIVGAVGRARARRGVPRREVRRRGAVRRAPGQGRGDGKGDEAAWPSRGCMS